MKKLLSLMLALLMAAALAACSSSGGAESEAPKEESVVGNWELEGVILGDTTYSVADYQKITNMDGYTVYVEITEDGNFVMKVPYFNNYESRGNWTQEGDTYKAVVDGDALTFKLNEGKLETVNGKEVLNAEYIFVRSN